MQFPRRPSDLPASTGPSLSLRAFDAEKAKPLAFSRRSADRVSPINENERYVDSIHSDDHLKSTRVRRT
jgi:hypothetical protein